MQKSRASPVHTRTFRDGFGLFLGVRIHADPDAVLLDADWHASYLTLRMSSGFPLPTSEFSALAKRRQLLRRVAAGEQRPEALGRQVWAIVRPRRNAPEGPLLWERRGFRVVERYAPVR